MHCAALRVCGVRAQEMSVYYLVHVDESACLPLAYLSLCGFVVCLCGYFTVKYMCVMQTKLLMPPSSDTCILLFLEMKGKLNGKKIYISHGCYRAACTRKIKNKMAQSHGKNNNNKCARLIIHQQQQCQLTAHTHTHTTELSATDCYCCLHFLHLGNKFSPRKRKTDAATTLRSVCAVCCVGRH